MTKIDSRDYEAGEKLTTHKAIVQHLLDGGIVKVTDGEQVYCHDEEGFYSINSEGSRYPATGNFPVAITWHKAILKRKPISWEDAVRALLDGKHVWDHLGGKWEALYQDFWRQDEVGSWRSSPNGNSHRFYLTPPPAESKPVEVKKERRKVSREDAICAMVRDPEQRAWDKDGHEHRWYPSCHSVRIRSLANTEHWIETCWIDGHLYLDPLEAK